MALFSPGALLSNYKPPAPLNMVDSQAGPGAYQTVNQPQIGFDDQANGLVPGQTRTPESKVMVLQSNDALRNAYSDITHGSNFPAQIQGQHVEAGDVATRNPELKVGANGQISGDPALTQAFTAADQTYDWSRRQLGRDFQFEGDHKLQVRVNDPIPGGACSGSGQVELPEEPGALDPDVVRHETGHAVLTANRPALDSDNVAGREVQEGYADGTAFFTAMEDKDVRANVLQNLQKGSTSNTASNIAEGYEQMDARHNSVNPTTPKTQGIRDLAAQPPADDPKSGVTDEHAGGLKMGHAAYQSTLDVYQQMRKDNPTGNPDDQLKQASQHVGQDFARAADFLPQGNHSGQGDFASAMIKADQTDQQGRYADVYSKNFKAAGVQPTDTSANDANVARLSQDANLNRPSDLQNAPAFRTASGHPAPAGARKAADDYLQQHEKELGFTGGGYHAQEIQHNDRGETFVYYSNGANRDDLKATRMAQVGFDKDGKIMTAREDKNTPPMPVPTFGLNPPHPWTPKDGVTPPVTPGGTPGYVPLAPDFRLDTPAVAQTPII
ncbi:MAG TPA: hypothetical protein VGO93_22025 [Candidatus Xenobia bacterium]|jgi:hypothetical protein